MALTPDTAGQVWQAIIERFPLLRHQLAFGIPTATSAPSTLVIAFPSQYNHWKGEWERPERLQKIEAAAQDVVGGPCRIRFELQESPSSAPAVEPAAAPARGGSRPLPPDVEHDPLVKTAIDRFGARIVRVVDELEQPGPGGS